MSLAEVRTILAAAVVSVTGLKCIAYVPSVVNPPLAILKPTSGDWDTNLPRSTPRRNFELIIVIPSTLSLEETQQTLDSYLETDKIKDAIEKAPNQGKYNYARVIGWRNYGDTVIDTYAGLKFDIVVV